MSTLPVAAPSRKPRPKPERRIRVLSQPAPDTDGWAAVEIRVGREVATYLMRAIPTDFDGTLAFEVEKLDTDLTTVEQYHVQLGAKPEARSCECLGYLRHGHCKHLDGLEALKTHDRGLPLFYSARDARHEPERCEPPQLDECEYFDRNDL